MADRCHDSGIEAIHNGFVTGLTKVGEYGILHIEALQN